jgi:hypothetical protein
MATPAAAPAAAPPPDDERAARRAAALAALRAQSASEYVTRSALEAGAAAVYVLPAAGVFFFLDGILAARFPRGAPPGGGGGGGGGGAPQSFPAVLGAAARYTVSASARSVAWCVLAAAGGTAAREAARLGPRHSDAGGGAADWRAAGAGFVAGAAAAVLLTADWARDMGRARRLGYVSFGGVLGVVLPHALARVGPSVRRTLERIAPPPDGAPRAAMQ